MAYREQWSERLAFYRMDVEQQHETFARDVAQGLAAPQKTLPAKYFYDARGSQLYEQICTLSEYYPYRAVLLKYMRKLVTCPWLSSDLGMPPKRAISSRHTDALAAHFCTVQWIFPVPPWRTQPRSYWPHMPTSRSVPYTLTLLAILGSFRPCAWRKKLWRFLAPISATLPAKKALTSCKVLQRYNEEHGRIEMHLRSRWAQHVTIAKTAQTISFAAGETIHTENSYKYSLEDIRALGRHAGLTLSRTWFDRQRYFVLGLFRRAED